MGTRLRTSAGGIEVQGWFEDDSVWRKPVRRRIVRNSCGAWATSSGGRREDLQLPKQQRALHHSGAWEPPAAQVNHLPGPRKRERMTPLPEGVADSELSRRSLRTRG